LGMNDMAVNYLKTVAEATDGADEENPQNVQ
jgi:hypothetical protein